MATPLPAPEPSLLKGVNVLLEGPAGTGKTYSIGTLVDTGLEVFYLNLGTGLEALLGYYTDTRAADGSLRVPRPVPDNLHWHSLDLIDPGGFTGMAADARQIATSTYAALCKIQDMNRHKNNPVERVLAALADFHDQRTGRSFGAADSWGPDRALVIDGSTELAEFYWAMQVGVKPVRDKPDYGIVQRQMSRFVRYCCDGCRCHFILIAHVEREQDELTGAIKIMTSAPGQKLAPILPSMFSDTILSVRNGTVWTWDTATPIADLKTRNLPVAQKLEPSFKQIIEKWISRGGRFSSAVKV
jgi:hypothetical protein